MKKALSVIGLALVLSGTALAQDVRSLGLGGALVPGPTLSPFNPAYLSYPADGRGGGLSLPVGLLNFVLNPQMNVLDFFSNRSAYTSTPPTKEFNFLAAYDQITHLNSFILNTPTVPRELTITLNSTGLSFFDETNQRPLTVDFSSLGALFGSPSATSGVNPFFSVPFSIGPVAIKLGVFGNVASGAPQINQALLADVADGNLSGAYSNAASISAQGAVGVSLDFGFSFPIDFDLTKVYFGARASGFFGLAYVDGRGQLSVKPGVDGSLSNAKIGYEYSYFVSSPFAGALGSGYTAGLGFGAAGDLGVVADLPGSTLGVPELEKLTVGLGVIGVVEANTWRGTEIKTVYDPDVGGDPVVTTNNNATRGGVSFNPLFTANVAGQFSLAGGFRVLAMLDAQVGRGGFNTHLGVEAQWTLFVVRGGVGLENGRFRFGVGAGLEFTPGIGLDLALTAHPTPFVGGTSFGVALAVRFGF
jgi:hypothetical protein